MITPLNPLGYAGAASLAGLDTLGNGGLVNALGAAGPSGDQGQLLSSLSAFGQLQSASDAFQSALALLEPPYQSPSTQTNNSNASVLSVFAQGSAPSGSYSVTVNNLAQAQTVQSAELSSPTSVIGSGNLSLSLGSYDATSNSFTSNGQAAVTVNVQNGTLNSVAAAINAAKAGVTASVMQDSGGYRLVLNGSNTGASQGFEVLADNASLSPLAYDPTNPGGSGLSLAQAGQDASLSVNGVAISSASNTNVGIASGLSVNLLQAGSSTVQTSADSNNLQAQAQSLISAYNTLQSSLASLQSGSGPEADIANLYAESLDMAAGGSFNNGGDALTQLSQLGINYQPPTGLGSGAGASTGSLTLNAGTLAATINADPSGTQSLINTAIQTLDTIASSYGGAGGVISSTRNAYESAAYVDTLLSTANAPLSSSPSTSELASTQQGPDAFNAQQIGSVQQYARSAAPVQMDNFNSALISLYVGSSYATGGLISALA